MTRMLATVALVFALGAPAAARGFHGGGFHGGGFRGGFHRGFGGRGNFFVGGGVFFDPFWWGYPYYYGYPYPYGYYPYYYPEYPEYSPPPAEEPGAAPGQAEGPGGATAEGASPSAAIPTYGLVQLRGVPDGASVDLDGRFWLTAEGLDARWLALPEGRHTVTVRNRNAAPLERTLDVMPGKTVTVQFRSPRRG
jgi:hypothetical protein